MYSRAETLKGVASTVTIGSGLTWLTYQNVASAVFFGLSLGASIWCWVLMRRAERAEMQRKEREAESASARHERLLNEIESLHLNQLRFADMVDQILHKES